MGWEVISAGRGGGHANLPEWWDDANIPGVRFQKSAVIFNQAMMDVMRLQIGSPVLLLIDRQGNAFGLRSPQEGEEQGAYSVHRPGGNVKSPGRQLGINCMTRLCKVFPWIKSGLAMKAQLVENGDYAMMVVRNKL